MNGTGVIGLEGQTPPKRQIFPQEWEVRTIVPGSVNSELLLPEMPVVHGGAVTIFDFGDFTIKSFRISDGRLALEVRQTGLRPPANSAARRICVWILRGCCGSSIVTIRGLQC
jgi:hypothetical protein